MEAKTVTKCKVVERTIGTIRSKLVFPVRGWQTTTTTKNKKKAICHKSCMTLRVYSVTNARTVVFKEWWGDELGDPIAQFEGSKGCSSVLSWSVYRVCCCNGFLPEVPGRYSLGTRCDRPTRTCQHSSRWVLLSHLLEYLSLLYAIRWSLFYIFKLISLDFFPFTSCRSVSAVFFIFFNTW